MTEIFDSLVHLDISLKEKALLSFIEKYLTECYSKNVKRNLMLRMDSIRKSKLDSEFAKITLDQGQVPAVLVSPNKTKSELKKELKILEKQKYKMFKIHPRHDKFDLSHINLKEIFSFSASSGIAIGLCCYLSSDKGYLGVDDFLRSLSTLLDESPKTKVVLYHGGGVHLLHFAEFARARKNTLLDLSFTLNKYRGSSIDQDIKFLFENFDKRICIGSDHPDFSFVDLRERFEYFAKGLGDPKLRRIAFSNLDEFLGAE